jgi:glycosyltransferase involved in cell wall biosynthesis
MKINPEYSVVIPVYNTEGSLLEIAKRLKSVFLNTVASSYEVIFVDDCSLNNNTWKILQELANSDSNVQAVRLMRNFGQQAATICGIRLAKGDYLITMDDDLQHLPEDIPALITKRNHDIVIGQFSERNHPFSKVLFSKVKGYFDRIVLGKPSHIQLSPYRLINRSTIEGMKHLFSTPYPFLPAMMFYVTKDIVGTEVNHAARHDGKTGYSFIKLIRLFSNLMVNNSSFLLRLIGNMGLTISLLSFALGLYFIYHRVVHATKIVGWTSVIVTVLFTGGLLLFSIGVIGEYLIRIIRGVDKWPNYIIREHIQKNPD